jgi:hypothetical protein
MNNSESYQMLHTLQHHLGVRLYEVDKSLEVVLTFKTKDGKVHQVCNTFVGNRNDFRVAEGKQT